MHKKETIFSKEPTLNIRNYPSRLRMIRKHKGEVIHLPPARDEDFYDFLNGIYNTHYRYALTVVWDFFVCKTWPPQAYDKIKNIIKLSELEELFDFD